MGSVERKPHKKGDIVLVMFPFTDMSGEKRRPALVVGNSEEHVVVAFISTRATGSKRWHISISPSEQSGIVSPSTIRSDKILSIDISIVSGAIGTAPVSVMKKVNALLRKLLAL
ncbi:hypothetical protein A3A38_01810 [Candidatus Kaiserbacteria bacterium RIFCSPLOWO2_01_FULL_53_17]|uniref:MazF family transcriptional regulator n=1 Tax=Candidatus Kaiserbacteria bacterium RIFCSPLOWO2_01_FULL_53_17 TaxID=1798511 RepID=A0A1F6EHC8_9BACT|nr:MAG: hypothetical protein A3A38_01810 [Candidatus Kaiserbacteria bacterium RIFCSPLOWO2_01_FULL_53_17]